MGEPVLPIPHVLMRILVLVLASVVTPPRCGVAMIREMDLWLVNAALKSAGLSVSKRKRKVIQKAVTRQRRKGSKREVRMRRLVSQLRRIGRRRESRMSGRTNGTPRKLTTRKLKKITKRRMAGRKKK